ncbi:unnamed protein product [Paramecium octaurelia]|uniref:Uncharacterized protein n=1 Tax=Paramecium octaurelia TaxID=43137 RepID=A0A8S1TXG1_PAROT|nr:unnamed protein product [Paramecium octaurelia]
MNCPYHPSNEISTICIANHNCQRKYCPECQYEHGGEINQYLPIELFSKKLKKKSQAYNLDNDQEQVKQHREFKILFANTQTNLKKVFHDVNQSIQGINEAIKKQAQVYLNLINTQFSLSESSYSDLDLMVKILERNGLDKWRFSKQYYYNLFEQLKSALKFEIEKFIRMINSLFSDILQVEQIKKQEGLKQQGEILIKTNFDIHYSAQRQIKYIYQGETLWIFNQYDILQQPQILKNLEQIKNLKWIGEVGKNMKKIGFWSSQWKGESSEGCGGEYTLDGNKRGKWKEMIKNYYDNSKVYEVGEYVNEFRSGIWKYIYNNQEIGGGEYIQSGQKNGQWIELSEEFSNKSQVTYNGEYKNDKKVGRWNTVAFGIQIGGGSYDEEGIEIKNGTWIELNTKFLEYSQIYYFGDYKNGQKVGKWSTWWNMANENKEIGGGSYDQGNNGMKMGKWIELSEDFQYLSQIIYQGEYLKGKKTGRWDILYRMITNENFTLIGGGLFDERGYGIKIGKWIEVNEGFGLNCVVTYNGEYENGKKVGRWSTIRDGLEIGGGSYDEKEKETKIGQWIELNDGFWEQSQVFYEGEYKNNKKVGKWEIFLNFEGAQKQIGYGSYDKEGIKIGKWVELNHRFQNCFQIFHVGHYKNGRKIGRWDIASLKMIKNYYDNSKVYEVGEYVNEFRSGIWKYIYNNQEIGGGEYIQSGQKNGQWIELSEEFSNKSQVTYNGEYKNDKKVGRWNTVAFGIQIGGGSYDEEGIEIKNGTWIELNTKFLEYSQIYYFGDYKNGQKVGKWSTWWNMANENKEIGGGSYDQGNNGMKMGKWIELSEDFQYLSQIIYQGEYLKGKKTGRWDILYRMITNENFTLIGGGLFDERGYGIKIGKWIEVNEGFGLNCVVTYNGEYENGKKVGRWSTIRDGLEIGGGSYDEKEKETKIGQWIELNDGFWEQSQVFYEGEYKNNKKVGKWEIFLNFEGAQKQIGYGSYDKEGIKIGKWVELNHRFQNCFQIFHVGHYKNGRKIGRWDIASLSQLIGGGTYDEQSDCAKVGEWIELSDEFQNSLKVLYNGQYNKGSKVGKWDISVCGKQIGGGNYEENGDGNKIGEWVELSKGFSSLQQVIYKGEYKNSKKIGRWNILYTKMFENQFKEIGGGSYDDNLKIGNWIELIDGFGLNGLVTLNGYYNNGKKVGNWMAFDCFKNEKLGDKFY